MDFEIEWVNACKEKLCPHLIKQIADLEIPPKWAPSLVASSVNKVKKHFKKIPVIVEIDKEHWYSKLNKANMAGVFGLEIAQQLDTVSGFSARANINEIKKLAEHDAVVNIWHDREVNALLDIASPVVGTPPVWKSGVHGERVGIAILDTGIYPHPDLTSPKNRIVAFKDIINHRSQPYDDNGHGTHCAGDAAGNGAKSNGKYRGPAPKANLIGVKVLDASGSGTMSSIIAGIEWCIRNQARFGIKILSMSIGAPTNTSYKKDPMCQAVRKAWKKGIVVCAAAGNDGPKAKTINSPGIEPSIITVGALDDKNTTTLNDDSVAYFSSRGPTADGLTKPDVIAPGANIISLRSPGSRIDRAEKKARIGNSYTNLSGTSMATPVCAGVVALILQTNPDLKPNLVKSILMSTCRSVSPEPNAQGAGLIEASAAIKQASMH